MASWYHFYTDESGVHNRPDYWIGGIKLTPRREELFKKKLTEFILQRGITHELKWNKVNSTYLSLYQEFISLFIKESAPQFKALHIIKGKDWANFGRSEEERFFKSYYVYFRYFASQSSRYNLTLDYKTSKWYRWQQLSYALNGKAGQNGNKGRYIASVVPRDSKQDILLQLADVILGSLAFNGEAILAKGILSSYTHEHINKLTKYGSELLSIQEFTPQK